MPVTCHISISLDGFVAGPDQSLENPIGAGGMRLHEWVFATAARRAQQGLEGGERSADAEVVGRVTAGVGASVMGRRMFGGGDGPWDAQWTGWWGEDPPCGSPSRPACSTSSSCTSSRSSRRGAAAARGRRRPAARAGRGDRLAGGHPRALPRHAIVAA